MTQSTYDIVVKQLAKENVVIIGLSPCQDNIFLFVQSITLGKFAGVIAESVRRNHLQRATGGHTVSVIRDSVRELYRTTLRQCVMFNRIWFPWFWVN